MLSPSRGKQEGRLTMIFADKLIQLRKKSGWSQEELAEQMGVSRQSISKWEGAQSIPDLEKIIRLAKLFSVSVEWLLDDARGWPKARSGPQRRDRRSGVSLWRKPTPSWP